MRIKIKTNIEDVVLELFPETAPKTVENFLKYVDDGSFRDLTFHRVIAGFMVQSGLFKKEFVRIPGKDPIPLENSGLSNIRGSVAMARHGDPNSATSEFFINVANNIFLDPKPEHPGYAVFGKVVEGLHVIDLISVSPTVQVHGLTDFPKGQFIIHEIVRE